jgi:hypothetical protein
MIYDLSTIQARRAVVMKFVGSRPMSLMDLCRQIGVDTAHERTLIRNAMTYLERRRDIEIAVDGDQTPIKSGGAIVFRACRLSEVEAAPPSVVERAGGANGRRAAIVERALREQAAIVLGRGAAAGVAAGTVKARTATRRAKVSASNAADMESVVLSALAGPMTYDEVAAAAGIPVTKVAGVLGRLCVSGVVVSLPTAGGLTTSVRTDQSRMHLLDETGHRGVMRRLRVIFGMAKPDVVFEIDELSRATGAGHHAVDAALAPLVDFGLVAMVWTDTGLKFSPSPEPAAGKREAKSEAESRATSAEKARSDGVVLAPAAEMVRGAERARRGGERLAGKARKEAVRLAEKARGEAVRRVAAARRDELRLRAEKAAAARAEMSAAKSEGLRVKTAAARAEMSAAEAEAIRVKTAAWLATAETDEDWTKELERSRRHSEVVSQALILARGRRRALAKVAAKCEGRVLLKSACDTDFVGIFNTELSTAAWPGRGPGRLQHRDGGGVAAIIRIHPEFYADPDIPYEIGLIYKPDLIF